MSTAPFTATVLGNPRIGPMRELKKAVESYWAGRIDGDALDEVARTLRKDWWGHLADAGLDSVPVGDFHLYDQMLGAAVLLGALPERVADIADAKDRYFAAARGNDDVQPLEMTKWFDTNYHYLVPEIAPSTTFSLHPEQVLGEFAEATALGHRARPVVIGPLTFLLLAKAVDGQDENLLTRVDELLPLYVDLLGQLADAGAEWVQIDEPVLVTDLDDEALATLERVHSALVAAPKRPKILVATYFGTAREALPVLGRTGVEGVAVDLVAGDADVDLSPVADRFVLAGVVDGHNIWRTDLDQAIATVRGLAPEQVAVSSSCSLQHVPYSLEPETALDESVKNWLSFGREKLVEIATIARAVRGEEAEVASELDAAREAIQARAADPRLSVASVRDRLAAATDADRTRTEAGRRLEAQRAALALPLLPSTTIGSFPQTKEIRSARAALRKGTIDQAGYDEKMKAEIADVIKRQEALDIDVLVHGEPERNDMVQYFAELLDGFVTTEYGWVQSYGSRCVRPPILFGDVSRPAPMTVDWITYAQSLTDRPVKGMLTGPVTILAWSFVRDDQPLAESADQVALAIRDETVDLEAAGVKLVQVDEPALRELLPLRKADQPAYLAWSVGAFRLATAGVRDETSIHTHLCYSEFGEVIQAIADLDADVTSIEAARSRMELLEDLNDSTFQNAIGPGVYDIHSPRVPSESEMVELLEAALRAVPTERLWVNPDCGLKTRGWPETEAALDNMVKAGKAVRAKLGAAV